MKSTYLKVGLLGALGGMALTLAGCGANLDGTGTTSTIEKVAIPSAQTTITDSNQNTVVSETADSVDGTMGAGGLPLSAVVEQPGAAAFSIFDFAGGRALNMASQGIGQQQALPSALVLTMPCDSGTATMTINVSDPSATTLQAGDSFTMSFSSCKDNTDGTTLNGSLTATLDSGTLEQGCGETVQGCGDVTLSMSFNDLQASGMGETVLADGGFTLTRVGAQDTVSGSDFYLYTTGRGVHLSNFTITSVKGQSSESVTVSMDLASTRLNGLVTIRTTTALVTVNGDERPSSGVLEISGANSRLTVTALDPNSVQLDLDVGADGTIDNSATVTWTDIESTP